MRLKRKLTVWSSALALSCAALSVGVAQAQAQQAQAPASAKQEEPERYGPFFFLRSEPDLLIYVGAVGANDMLNLKKALREHPTISTIVLQNNGGGLVHIGLVVAEEIYERGLNTYIPRTATARRRVPSCSSPAVSAWRWAGWACTRSRRRS